MTNISSPSGFAPVKVTSYNRYVIKQADTNAYRVQDVVKSANNADATGVSAVTLASGVEPVRGVILSIEPANPANGLAGLVRLQIPAVKMQDYYVWVLDDPDATYSVQDDGLTPANLIATNVGKLANFLPNQNAATGDLSTALLSSANFGGGAVCRILGIIPGSSLGAFASWRVKFALHELASDQAPSGGGSFATITGAPADNAALNTALANTLKPPISWSASATGGTPTLTSGTAVLGTSFKNITAGLTTFTTAIDGISSVQQNDILVCLTAGTYTLSPAGVQTAAQVAIGATAGVVAVSSAGIAYKPDGSVFSAGGPSATAFANIWDTASAAGKDMGQFTITAALALTSNDGSSVVGGFTEAVLIADGTHIPTFDGSTITSWNNTAGALNRVELKRIGTSKFWMVGSNVGSAVVIPVAAVITSAPVLGSITTGGSVTWTPGSVTGTPAPTVSYSLKKNGTVVSSPATSGSYNTIASADVFIVTQAATNAAYGGGTATPVDSAPVTVPAGFPALTSPLVGVFGDSLTAHGVYNVSFTGQTLSRASGTGRITTPIANANLFGTPRVAIVNTVDATFAVLGRNNYADAGAANATLSIHTTVADPVATGLPAGASTVGPTTTTASIGNGTLLDWEQKDHVGDINCYSALNGGGVEVIFNCAQPGAQAGSSGMAVQLAYAHVFMALYPGMLWFFKAGTNDMKGSNDANTTFAACKALIDGLTGDDGNGGNGYVVICAVPPLGSAFSGYATVNSRIGAPTDSSLYLSQNRLNYQLAQYAASKPSKLLFSDEWTPSYNATQNCMYDATYPDANGVAHTADGTHYLIPSSIPNGANRAAATAPYVTYPVMTPASAADATTPNGHTRLNNRGPWNNTVVTTGYNNGGATSSALPKGGVGGMPTGWSCGASSAGICTMAMSVASDARGYFVNAECTALAANATMAFYPFTSAGVLFSTLGITAGDNSEYEFVFEVQWDNAWAAGLSMVQAQLNQSTSGNALDGMTLSAVKGLPDTMTKRVLRTGRWQNSNSGQTKFTPQINVAMSSILNVACNVGVRFVGLIKV